MLTKLKQLVEKAMTNKVESDNNRTKFMQQLTVIEDFLTAELNLTSFKARSQSRVLD
jgi:hypothetical protein